MTLQKKDFVEIEFTGRTKEGELFDSNIKEDLEKANLSEKIKAKPFIFSLGEGMFLRGIEDFLIGKDIGKEYEIELAPEKAFGNRLPQLVQLMPMKVFIQQKVNPVPGAVFNFDGRLAKVLSVSGGRVMTDFNNPLSGKVVVYKIKILRKIDDLNKKINAFTEFLFKREFKFEINEKEKKIIFEVEKPMVQFVEMFSGKFKDVFSMDLEIKELKEIEKVHEKKENKKANYSKTQ